MDKKLLLLLALPFFLLAFPSAYATSVTVATANVTYGNYTTINITATGGGANNDNTTQYVVNVTVWDESVNKQVSNNITLGVQSNSTLTTWNITNPNATLEGGNFNISVIVYNATTPTLNASATVGTSSIAGFTVSNNTAVVSLSSTGNANVNSLVTTTATITTANSQLTGTIYFPNGTSGTTTGTYTDQETFSTSGSKIFTFNSTGNQNYTSATTSLTLSISASSVGSTTSAGGGNSPNSVQLPGTGPVSYTVNLGKTLEQLAVPSSSVATAVTVSQSLQGIVIPQPTMTPGSTILSLTINGDKPGTYSGYIFLKSYTITQIPATVTVLPTYHSGTGTPTKNVNWMFVVVLVAVSIIALYLVFRKK